MPSDSDFQALFGRVRAGDEAAAEELLRRYEPAIRRAIRFRLNDTRLRRLLDSMDICQSVFGSFFVRSALGQYDIETPEELLQLLMSMSRKKLTDQHRRAHAARRDVGRDAPSTTGQLFIATASSPSQQISARELLGEVRRRLSDEEIRLAEQRASGTPWDQIAAEHGETPEALRKRLERAVDRVARELGLEEDDG
jgi:RNA polymerase sigma-70 factor (ECF subfamily)